MALLTLLALAACTGPQPGDTGGEVLDPLRLRLVPSEAVTTVFTATWQAPGAAESWVEYGEGAFDLVAPGLPDGEGGFEIALLGLHTEADVQARAVALVEGERVEGTVHVATTGPLPPELPPLELRVSEEGRTEAGWLVAKVGSPAAIAILDMEGRYVWWSLVAEPYNFARAILSRDRRSVVYMGWDSATPGGAPKVERISLQGEVLSTTSVPDAHHDLAELWDGTLAVLAKDAIVVDEEVVKGERIVEIAPDGTTTEVWSLWDHLDYDPDLVPGAPGDWAHANAIEHDPTLDAWHVSFKNFDSIWRIDRPTGEVLWELGGARSAFSDAGGGTDFSTNQHQFQLLDDGLLVFDNGSASDLDSRVVEYAVDWEGERVEERWEHHADPPLYCTALGDVSRLPDGNTLVTWSTLGRLDQVAPGGEVLWRLSTDLGGVYGYTTWRESLYDAP